MSDIVLSTLNARHIHAAFGLRYLLANLGELQSRACLLEFDVSQRPLEIAERVLQREPKIVGFGVYIWNATQTWEVVAILKRLRPELIVILGGPEISYETEGQPLVQMADYVVTGEADLKFAEVCRQLLSGQRPSARIIPAHPPEFEQLVLPYELYDEQDIAHRVIYVEASRGCPFSCEFCLSSLDVPVRAAPLAAFLEHLHRLLNRGASQLKFVDRTFNLSLKTSGAILEFLLQRYRPGHFFHFEMIPDRLPGPLRESISRFPPGALQFEVGVQTFNPEVAALIQRRQNYERLEENLRFLRRGTGVHIHADLIAGLPGEDMASFGAGFDRLVGLGPQEIQVGILKRLRGTPIVRHDAESGMVYSPLPPYEILRTRLIGFEQMQRLRRFARYWDLVGNSGNFLQTTPLVWSETSPGSAPGGETSEARGQRALGRSPFESFMGWSDWLYGRVGRTDGIALGRLMELLFEYLTAELKRDAQTVAAAMWRDHQRGGRRDTPSFLRQYLASAPGLGAGRTEIRAPKRQRRHLSTDACAGAERR
jgi:radical SAM superfamily enzyme YgiQ (UPF0313 family)